MDRVPKLWCNTDNGTSLLGHLLSMLQWLRASICLSIQVPTSGHPLCECHISGSHTLFCLHSTSDHKATVPGMMGSYFLKKNSCKSLWTVYVAVQFPVSEYLNVSLLMYPHKVLRSIQCT